MSDILAKNGLFADRRKKEKLVGHLLGVLQGAVGFFVSAIAPSSAAVGPMGGCYPAIYWISARIKLEKNPSPKYNQTYILMYLFHNWFAIVISATIYRIKQGDVDIYTEKYQEL